MKKKLIKKLLIVLSRVTCSILIIFALVEFALRVTPSLIPVKLLVHFNEKIRAEIAQRMELPRRDDTTLLNRDDGGRPLRIFKSFTRITYNDNDPGIVKTVVMDEMGFGNPTKNSYSNPIFDIITIGDSFTWCTTVAPEGTWTSNLSSLSGLSAYNLGMPGIGIYECLQILKKFGIPKSPKIVIMNIYEGNDLRDAIKHLSYLEQTEEIEKLRQISITRHFYKALLGSPVGRYSYSFNLMLAAAKCSYINYKEKPKQEINFRYSVVTPLKKSSFNTENKDTDEVLSARYLYSKKIDLGVFTEALKTYVTLSHQQGFIPVVTYTPSAYTAYSKNVVFDDPTLSKLMSWFSWEQRNFFKIKGKDLGYIFVDLTPSIQEAAQINCDDNLPAEDLLYYQTNLHLTRHGHMVIAETVTQALKHLNTTAYNK